MVKLVLLVLQIQVYHLCIGLHISLFVAEKNFMRPTLSPIVTKLLQTYTQAERKVTFHNAY